MASIAVEATGRQYPPLTRNRTFIALWLGSLVSVLGDGFHSVALGLWVLQATGSASAMALVMSSRIIVSILLGAVAGTVVDRSDRRMIMIIMNVARFLSVGAIALLVEGGVTTLAPIIGLTALTAIASQFYGPSMTASLVNIVGKEELPRATGMLQMSNTVGQMVGPFLGGVVVAMLGGWVALAVDAGTFLFAALMVLVAGTFPSPKREGKEKGDFWGDLTEGFRYIRQHPVANAIMFLAPIINFFGNAIGVLLPVIAVKVWLADSVQFGALEALFPTGFAIGAAAIMALSKKLKRRGALMMGGVSAAGLAVTVIALMPSINAALPVVVLAGVGLALANVLLQITLQSEVAPEVQGRVFGTLGSLVNIASPLAMLLAGVLGDAFSPTTIVAVAGVLLALVGGVGYLTSRGLRQYN